MKFISQHVFLFVFIQLLILFKATAQLEHIAIQNLTQLQGLSNNYINCLVQDTIGFIWIGTNDGLNRYDGYVMKTYYNSPTDSLSISDNKITALCIDADGRLWIGTESNSVCRYNPTQDNFVRYGSQTHGDKLISNHFITDIKTDQYGKLWVLTQEGLNWYNREDDYFEPINFGVHYCINSESILHIESTGVTDNVLNVALKVKDIDYPSREQFIESLKKSSNMNLLESEIQLLIKYAKKWASESEKKYNQFITMASGKNDIVWLIYKDAGFASYNLTTKVIQHFGIPTNLNNSDESIPIRSIIVNDDDLWLGTFNNGVYNYSISTNSFKKIFSNNKQGALAMSTFENHIIFFSEQQLCIYPIDRNKNIVNAIASKSIPEINFNVTDIIKDNAQNFWIATEGAGLFLMYPYKKFNVFDDTKNSKVHLSKREVTALYADSSDNLYVGYYRNNIDKINWDTKTNETCRNEKDFTESAAPGSVFALVNDAKNNLWLGSYYSGLQKMDIKSKKVRHFDPTFIKDLRKIVFDRNGNILAAAHGFGLVKYDSDGKYIKHWTANYLEWERNLPDNWINDLCIDKNNKLWIATSQGLCVADIEAEQFKSYQKTDNDSNGISHNSVNTVYCDNKNNIWVGTWNGLNLFNSNSETFTHYSILDGLANNSINAIIEDDKGDIWLSTNVGLTRLVIDPNNTINHIENYDNFDGVPAEYYLRAAAKLSDGTLFFGGKNGITWFIPDSIKPNNSIPRVAITDLKIFNRSIFDKHTTMRHLRNNFVKKGEIVLSYEQNVIGIDFSSLNFIPNSKNQYASKLEGFDVEWQEIGNAHSVTYTNLEPGTYYFSAKAINKDGLNSLDNAQLKIVILPPFWRSTMGYFTIALLVILILFLFFLILRSRIILINRIKMRRLEAENLKDLDKSKSSFFTNITHEFRTPITLILGPVKKILNTEPEKLDILEIKTQLKLVNRNAELLMRLVNQILDFKKADAGKLSFRPTFDDIIPFILNIGESFKSLAVDKNIAFNMSTNIDELYMEFEPDKIEKIVNNLLSNAFKYTLETGLVTLTIKLIEENSKQLQLIVKDSGIGISEENQQNIFSLYYQADNAQTKGINGTGVGLYLVKTYAELHEGRVAFNSKLDHGSTFMVEIPVNEKSTHIKIDETEIRNTDKLNQFRLREDTNKVKILIVEDNVDIMFFLKNELEDFFIIYSAKNGVEALKILNSLNPDIILSDIMMPKMDGYELCKRIKNNIATCHIPVLLLTAKISHESQMEGYAAGADDYLTKPFDSEILIAKIQRILELRKQIQLKILNKPDIIPNEIKNSNSTETIF